MKANNHLSWWQILSSAAWTLGLAFVPVRALADTVISSDYIDLSGDIHQVHDVSADGAVVVGQLKPYQWGETFVWKEDALTYLDALLTPVIDWEHPIAVSADGSTIVGTMLNGREEAFRLKDGELTGLGVLPGTTTSQASAVSADGSVIVGRSGNEAFRYEDGIMAGLGVADDYLDSWAAGVSADGSVVIGTAANEDRQEAFRCEGDTMTLLGVLPDEWRSSATHLSADGSTIMVLHDSNDGGPFIRWKDGVTDTISQLGGWPWSDGVYGLSGDGSVIVGGEDWSRAFRWENGNKAYLPPIIEGDFEETREEATPRAEHVSLDGSIVSGYLFWPRAEDVIFGGVAPLPTTAVYWSEENDYAVVYLNDLLDQAGIDREGYELRKAIVTADGSTLIAPAENGVSSRLYRIRLDRSPARMWGAYSVEADGTSTDYGWCDTGAFCGLLYLFGEPDPTTGACWTYSPSLDNYLYFCRAPQAEDGGNWVHIARRHNQITLDDYPYNWNAGPHPTRFQREIDAYLASDQAAMPPEDAIVAIGSSSMYGWHDRIHEDLDPLTLIPRGFGGSSYHDVVWFAQDIILPYKPRAVLVYEGENEIFGGGYGGVSPEWVRGNLKFLVEYCRGTLPGLRFYIIALKPSIDRWSSWPKMTETNALMQAYCDETAGVTFIDPSSALLQPDGTLRENIYSDGLHFNSAGYDIWASVIGPVLVSGEAPYEGMSVTSWANCLVHYDGEWVDTYDWLGWVHVVHKPWIYCLDLDAWMYLPEDKIGETGVWAFLAR